MAARFTFLHTINGEIAEHDLIVCDTADEWEAMPESRCPAWSIILDGVRVLALAPVLVGLELTEPDPPSEAE